jgi:transcriptional regulator with XRE-family HTH domain
MSLRLDKSYNFVDKHPIIDVIRTAIEESPYSPSRVAELAGLNHATITRWLNGGTRNPRAHSIDRVAAALGKRFKLVDARDVSIVTLRPVVAAESQSARRRQVYGWRRWR